jgi:DNA-binding LacI/PurR family transcriptional regulator
MTDSETRPLLANERRAQILDAVRRDGTAHVNALAEQLGVTAITIRRDISLMSRQGLVRRVHGGVTLPEQRQASDDGDAALARTTAPTASDPAAITIGMMVPSLDYYWPDIIRSARRTAERLSARIVLRGATYEAADERHQLTRLVEDNGLDGLLVAPTTAGAEGESLVRWLNSLDTPVVLLERTAVVGSHREAMESVVSDHALGAGMAVHHLADLGHRRIGLLTTVTSPTSPHVRRGWREACEHLGLPTGEGTPDVDSVDHRGSDWLGNVDALLEQCRAMHTTALLVHSDQEAISLVERGRELGITVPGDLAIVTYDDEVAGLADPPLTSVHPPRDEIGDAAVRLLVDRIRDPGRPAHRLVVAPRLVVRESASAPLLDQRDDVRAQPRPGRIQPQTRADAGRRPADVRSYPPSSS